MLSSNIIIKQNSIGESVYKLANVLMLISVLAVPLLKS